MRKEPNAPFGREAFVLEQHLDKLGANGWELISVAGTANGSGLLLQAEEVADLIQRAAEEGAGQLQREFRTIHEETRNDSN